MIVLLYLEETFVRERNNPFLHHLPREMSIPEHYRAKCTSPAKNRDGFLPRVMINMTKYYRSCLIPWRGKEIIFESCRQAKLRLCAPYCHGDSKLSISAPPTIQDSEDRPVSMTRGYPHI